MSLPIGRSINRVLAPFGIRVCRAARAGDHGGFSATGKLLPRRVGKYEILMHSNSALYKIYGENPQYSWELGMIVRAASEKYPSARVIDVGANVGDTLAIVRSQAEVNVLAIEGDPVPYSLLEVNSRLFPGTATMMAFLGDRDGEVRVRMEKRGWNTTLVPTGALEKNGSAEAVSIVTLDGLLEHRPERAEYKVLKVDTEGFDFRIVRGARRLIEEARPVVYLEYNRANMDAVGEDGLGTIDALRGGGYSSALVWDSLGRFVFMVDLSCDSLVSDLHQYLGATAGSQAYFDIAFFHSADRDLAAACAERARQARGAGRLRTPGPP